MPIAREILEIGRKSLQVISVVVVFRPKIAKITKDKGVYPQSDGSLAVVDIDASKGFVDLWEHLALAILANFDVKKQLKRLSTKI